MHATTFILAAFAILAPALALPHVVRQAAESSTAVPSPTIATVQDPPSTATGAAASSSAVVDPLATLTPQQQSQLVQSLLNGPNGSVPYRI